MMARLFFPRLFCAAAALIAGACVQTNVTRAPLEEEGTRPAAAAPVSAGPPAAVVPPSARTPEVFVPAVPVPATPVPAPPAVSLEPSSAPGVIASNSIRLEAPGCQSAGRHLHIRIPRSTELDRSYRGAAAGIEIRKTVLAGAGGFRHAKLQDGVLDVDLWARGDGIAIGALGQESCSGSGAAAVVFEAIPHYR